MAEKQNNIKLTGNGNIVIQDANSRDIIINLNDPQLFEKIKALSNEQIDDLKNKIDERNDKFLEKLKSIVSNIVSQKNIVQNSTINAESVKIGDTVENHNHYESYKNPKQIGLPPSKPAVFLGRDNSPEEIHQKLINNKGLLLLVNGEGGIGKTTLAAQYYHIYINYYSHLIWLVAEKGIKEALKSLAIHLKLIFNPKTTEEQQLELIIAEIINLDKPVLLIFDNANELKDLEENYQILRKLPNTHILMTSRLNSFEEIENYKVEHLTKEFALKLFKYHHKFFNDKEDELLEKLLEAVGYNTLIIELLAKNLNKFNDEHETYYPLQKLLEDIQEKGLLALSQSDEVKTDYYLHKAKPEEIVSAMFDIAKLNDLHKMILSIFSVLPPVAVPYIDLKYFLPNTDRLNNELKRLYQEGWCDYDAEHKAYKLNPVIAEVTRQKNNERIKQDIAPMIEALTKSLDYDNSGNISGNFEEINRFISYAENTVIYKNFINSSYYLIFERIGNFYKTYGNLDKALKFFEERSRLGKELYESQPNNVGFKNGLAISYSKLGSTHTSLGNLDKALKFFEDETLLFEELYESQPNNVGFKNGLAISYVKLGFWYSEGKNTKKALEYFEQAKQHFQELHEHFPTYKEFENNYYWTVHKIEELKTINLLH